MIILFLLVLMLVIPVVLFIQHKNLAGWIVIGIYIIGALLLAHPVCQVNIPDGSTGDGYRVTWQTVYSPSDIVRYVRGEKIMFGSIEGSCKSWVGKQLFF